jgi:Putative MetA-pathway of phenol degradation
VLKPPKTSILAAVSSPGSTAPQTSGFLANLYVQQPGIRWSSGIQHARRLGGQQRICQCDPDRSPGQHYLRKSDRFSHGFHRRVPAVAGFTYNFENPSPQYQNGVDFHFDWGASQFLNKNVHVGLVGYVFQQVTGDSGVGATLGSFESRVAGIGPQIGFIVPLGSASGYINIKGYKEFAAEDRREGWDAWVTFSIAFGAF